MPKSTIGSRTSAACVLAFLLSARIGAAQDAPAPAPLPPAAPPKISYVGGQLKIDAVGSTLADVLKKVGSLAGVNIDIPAGANTERMPFVELGPGPPREILATLLNDSNFDYLIQASDSDPLKIQSVMVMVREKKGSSGNDAGGRPTRSPFVRAAAPPAKSEDSQVPDNTQTQAVTASTEVAPADAQPPAAQPEPPPQPEQTALVPLTIPENSMQIPLVQPGLSKGAMSPPQTLNSTTINQQLQQMYQQRMQMIQQGQTNPPVVRQQ